MLKLEPSNVKALFRAARAAAKLGRLEQAGQLVDQGLGLDPENQDLGKLKQVGECSCWNGGVDRVCLVAQRVVRACVSTPVWCHWTRIYRPTCQCAQGSGMNHLVLSLTAPTLTLTLTQDLAPARTAAEERRRREEEALERALAPARKLAAALEARGYKLTRPQVSCVMPSSFML